MAIDKLSIHDLPIANIPGAPPPLEDTPNEEPIDPQQPDLTCTPDPTKTKPHSQVVGVEYAGGKAYAKATGLYNRHRKYRGERVWQSNWIVQQVLKVLRTMVRYTHGFQ